MRKRANFHPRLTAEVGQAHDGARAGIASNTAGRNDGNENDAVHDVCKWHEVGLTVCNDKWRAVRALATEDVGVLRGDVDGDHERAKQVEERQPQPDRADGAWNRLLWIRRLSSDQARIFRSRHGEDAGWHHGEEALEAMCEGLRFPVVEAGGVVVGAPASGDDWQR